MLFGTKAQMLPYIYLYIFLYVNNVNGRNHITSTKKFAVCLKNTIPEADLRVNETSGT